MPRPGAPEGQGPRCQWRAGGAPADCLAPSNLREGEEAVSPGCQSGFTEPAPGSVSLHTQTASELCISPEQIISFLTSLLWKPQKKFTGRDFWFAQLNVNLKTYTAFGETGIQFCIKQACVTYRHIHPAQNLRREKWTMQATSQPASCWKSPSTALDFALQLLCSLAKAPLTFLGIDRNPQKGDSFPKTERKKKWLPEI